MQQKSKSTSIIEKPIKELFILSRCKTKVAYSTRLKFQQYKLDLKKLATTFQTIIETPVVIVLKIDGIELTAHNFGELLFRGCEDLDRMQKIAQKVYEAGLVKKQSS